MAWLLGSAAAWSGEWREVALDGHRLQVELAISDQDRNRGLAGRTSLGPDQGMLFVYKESQILTFWMAGMKIKIDLLWLTGRRVAGIEANLAPPRPGETPRTVTSPGAVDKVLELPAGWAARHQIRPGALLTFPPGLEFLGQEPKPAWETK